MLKNWAEANGYGNLYAEYTARCEAIADQCEAEGYPANGSNYDLRVERLQADYPELFGDE